MFSLPSLKAKLLNLNYTHTLSYESAQLVDQILNDLLKSNQNFQILQRKNKGLTDHISSLEREYLNLNEESQILKEENKVLNKKLTEIENAYQNNNKEKKLQEINQHLHHLLEECWLKQTDLETQNSQLTESLNKANEDNKLKEFPPQIFKQWENKCIGTSNNDIIQISHSLEETEEWRQKFDNEKSSHQHTLKKLTDLKEKSKIEIDELRKEINLLKTSNKFENLEKKIEEFHQNIENVITQNSTILSENQKHQRLTDYLRNEIEQTQGSLSEEKLITQRMKKVYQILHTPYKTVCELVDNLRSAADTKDYLYLSQLNLADTFRKEYNNWLNQQQLFGYIDTHTEENINIQANWIEQIIVSFNYIQKQLLKDIKMLSSRLTDTKLNELTQHTDKVNSLGALELQISNLKLALHQTDLNCDQLRLQLDVKDEELDKIKKLLNTFQSNSSSPQNYNFERPQLQMMNPRINNYTHTPQ